jgi:ketosteroid isomerase-like protein
MSSRMGRSSAIWVVFCFCVAASAQERRESVRQTVAGLDAELFDAVNRCDLPKVASFWAEDAEFLHDKSDPIYGRDAIVASIKNNLCGKVVRELVPGTLDVSPLQGDGAVETGVHRFLHPGAQDHGVVGEARFIHVWKKTRTGWKITRVISYDHRAVP